MLAVSGGVDSEPILEKEALRVSESVADKRGEEEGVKELSEGVVSWRVFCIRSGKRRGYGVVFRIPGSMLFFGAVERGTNVTGFEVGLRL